MVFCSGSEPQRRRTNLTSRLIAQKSIYCFCTVNYSMHLVCFVCVCVLTCQTESEHGRAKNCIPYYSISQRESLFHSKNILMIAGRAPMNLFTDISQLKLVFLFAVIQCISKQFFFSLLICNICNHLCLFVTKLQWW